MIMSIFSDKWVTEEITANVKGLANIIIDPIMTQIFKKPLPKSTDRQPLEEFSYSYPEIANTLRLKDIDPELDLDVKRSYSINSHRTGTIVDVSFIWANGSYNPLSSIHIVETLKLPRDNRVDRKYLRL